MGNQMVPRTYWTTTAVDANWDVLLAPPAFTDYPFNHVSLSDTTAEVLTKIFGYKTVS